VPAVKVLTVVGARPQFIKAAPVSRVLRRRHHEVLLHTGQHYDDAMSDLFFRQLGIPAPDINLGVGSESHAVQTAAMMPGIERAAVEAEPNWVLLYGDTNSTLAGALVAAKLHIPIAHVEAGLRSHDKRMPEEVNRVVADHLSDLVLCPTPAAAANLAQEGITEGVRVVGDVMYDAFREHAEVASARCSILGDLALRPGGYQLLTLHRAENVDAREALDRILQGIGESGCDVVFPMHPRTKAALERFGLTLPPNVRAIGPVGYLEMLVLELNAEVIVTDSGGVQKEAFFAARPCVTLRDTTEWTETVQAGWNVLVGSDPGCIAAAMRTFRPRGEPPRLFGDGRAAQHVVDALQIT